jgi:hypothetical protein
VHLGIARTTIEQGGQFEGGAIWLLPMGRSRVSIRVPARCELVPLLHGKRSVNRRTRPSPRPRTFATSAKALRPEGRKPADDRAVFRAVLLEEEMNHVVPVVVREVDVDVRELVHRHPFLVEEPLEVGSNRSATEMRAKQIRSP